MTLALVPAVVVLIGFGMWVCDTVSMSSAWWQSGRASILTIVVLAGALIFLALLWRLG